MLSSSARPSNSPYYGIGAFALFSPLAVLYTVASHLVLKCTGRLPEPLAVSATITTSSNAPVETETQIQRVAIVTGSNTGIGYETARALVLDHGMEVILACRSRDKAQAAADRIQQAFRTSASTPSQRVGRAVVIHPLDLASPQSVLDFCAALKDKYTAVHVLVNNAGRNTSGKSPSGGNLDLLFASNFIGHFLLTSQIMPLLQAGVGARIVNVSSVMHHFCRSYGDLESVDFWKRVASADVPPHDTYSLSKLAAVLFTIQLRTRYPDIHSLAVNPGAVNSDIWRNFPRFFIPLFRLIYLNNKQGCQTSVAASVLQNENGLRGTVMYLQPYALPRSDCPPLPFLEMLGPYVGYRPTPPRLPTSDGGEAASRALWNACDSLLSETPTNWPTLRSSRP